MYRTEKLGTIDYISLLSMQKIRVFKYSVMDSSSKRVIITVPKTRRYRYFRKAWPDLAVYCYYRNMEDLHIERIYFDGIYWNDLKRSLLDFCLHAVVPEIITRGIKRGKPLHPTVIVTRSKMNILTYRKYI